MIFCSEAKIRDTNHAFPSILRGLKNVPHLFHELPLSDQTDVLIKHAKICWFTRELDSHPVFEWTKKKNLFIDEMALAQHYEIHTGWVDVSQSFDVAAFFATCYYRNSEWQPIEKGEGIMYRVERRKIKSEFLEPVGLQPFPRPLEQWAWLVEVPMGYDFENHPAISYITFDHDIKVSKHFLEMFDYGKALFPPDPLSVIAEHINQSNILHIDDINTALESYSKVDGGLKKADREEVSEIISNRIKVSNEHVEILDVNQKINIKEEWDKIKEDFGKNITPFIVRAEKRQ